MGSWCDCPLDICLWRHRACAHGRDAPRHPCASNGPRPGRRRCGMSRQPIRFATFLAPNMLPVYQCVAGYVGRRLGCETELVVGSSFGDFARGAVDVGFICGLPYVALTLSDEPSVELLAAPVLQGGRYRGL